MSKRKPASQEPPLMSFTVAKNQFLLMMDRCSEAKAEKILLTAKDTDNPQGILTMTAVGMPVSVVARAWTADKEQGSVLVHYAGSVIFNLKDLRSVVSAMPDDLLDILCTKEHRVVVEAAGHAEKKRKRTFAMTALRAEDYPRMIQMPTTTPVRSLPGGVVAEAIERVKPFVDDDEDKKTSATNGVLLQLGTDGLRAVATNRHMIGCATIDHKVTEPAELLIPGALLGLVTKLALLSDEVGFVEGPGRIFIDTEQTSASCLQHVDRFPDVMSVVQRQFKNSAPVCQLDGPQLAEAVAAMTTVWHLSYMATLDKEKRPHGVVRAALEGNTLALSTGFESSTTDPADGSEDIDVGNPDDHSITFCAQPHYLRACAAQTRGAARLLCDPRDPELMFVALEAIDKSFWAGFVPLRNPNHHTVVHEPDPVGVSNE